MDAIKVKKVCEKHSGIVEFYFKNDAKNLYKMIDEILFRLKYNVDSTDFYSLANELFLDILCRYDEMQDFNVFLYSCLTNKFKTEMTRRNRIKRMADKLAISWDTPLDEYGELTIGDFISGTKRTEHFDIDKTFFEDDGEKYSERMLIYVTKLSKLQKRVVKLIISGYSKQEIINILHISSKDYSDCIQSIKSFKNKSIFIFN